MAAKKKTKKDSSKPVVELKAVSGVDMHKVDETVLRQSLVSAGLYSPADAKKVPADKAVQELRAYYEKNTPESEMADCDNCKGMSDVRFDRCPYCGVSAEDGNGEQPNNQQDNDSKETTVKDDKSKEPAAKSGGEATEDKKGGKLAKTAPALPAGVTEDKLNAAIKDVVDLKSSVSVSYWTLGKKIGEIFEMDLWKARTDVEGGFAYKHWNQFCLTELGMTPGHATNLMDVAKKYTEKQVREFGHSKLAMVLKGPPEDEPKLLDLAKKSSKRQLQEEVERLKKEKNYQRDTGRGTEKQRKRDNRKNALTEGGKRGPKTKGPKSLDPKIAVAAILKTYTVPLYKKPERGQEPDKRAKRMGDEPVGWLDLVNDLRMFIAIDETPTGEMRAKVRFERIAE